MIFRVFQDLGIYRRLGDPDLDVALWWRWSIGLLSLQQEAEGAASRSQVKIRGLLESRFLGLTLRGRSFGNQAASERDPSPPNLKLLQHY